MTARLAFLVFPVLIASFPFLQANDDSAIGTCEKYTARRGTDSYNVQIIDNKTKEMVFDLAGDGVGSPYAAFFSDDSSLIAFSSGTSSLGTRLFIYRLDGRDGAVPITLPDSIDKYIFGDHTYMKTTRVVGKKVYFNISNDGKAMPFILDTKTRELRKE